MSGARGALAPASLALGGLVTLGFGVTRLGSLATDRRRRDPQWIVGALEIASGLVGATMLAATS